MSCGSADLSSPSWIQKKKKKHDLFTTFTGVSKESFRRITNDTFSGIYERFRSSLNKIGPTNKKDWTYKKHDSQTLNITVQST